jgi:hypothetical protein
MTPAKTLQDLPQQSLVFKTSEEIKPDAENEDDLHFIQQEMTMLAAWAYGAYLEHGKGVLIIDQTSRIMPPNQPGFGFPIGYIPASFAEPTWPAWYADMVEKSNPEEGVVVVLNKRDTSRAYRFRTLPPPPVAYELMKDQLSEFKIAPRFLALLRGR